MWNILNRTRCETLSDLFRDSIKYDKDWLDATIKILNSDYKDSLESGDINCLSRGSLYYLSWVEEKEKIKKRTYSEQDKYYYINAMEWLGYLFQGFYEDFYITGKWLLEKLSNDDLEWLINNYNILHTQDGKYVFEEMKRVRGIA